MQSSTMINRKHAINAEYFNKIDNERKAYWLGFIWADGTISQTSTRSSGPNRLRIAQKWDERQHLEHLKHEIGSTHPIVCVRHDGNHDVAQLDINCRPLCQALQELGYGTKDIRVNIPRIQDKLISHFIRGYFDGDGCLSIYTQTIKRWTVPKQEWSITGNRLLMQELKDRLTADADVTPSVKLKNYAKSPSTASLRYGKKSDISKLYDYLYTDATVYLKSKHAKFVEFFSRYAS